MQLQNIQERQNGDLKEMSSEGTITADIIKNALFNAADEIEGRYSKMPKTFGDYWTLAKNKAIQAFTPVINKISAMINTPKFQSFFDKLCIGIQITADAVIWLIDSFVWLGQTLEPVLPVIMAIVGAFILFSVVSAIVSGAMSVMSAIQGIQAAASMMQAGATLSATAAQWGLNTALLACPLTWIIVLIVALVAVLVILWEKCEGFRDFVGNMVAHNTKTLGWFYNNIVVPIANGVVDVLNWLNEAQRNFWKFAINGYADMAIKIAESIGWVMEKLGGLIDLYNQVAGTLGGATINTNFNKDTAIENINKLRNDALTAIDSQFDSKTKDHWDNLDLDKWNAASDALGDKVKNFKFSDIFNGVKDKINGELDIGDKLNNSGKNSIPVTAKGGKIDSIDDVNISDEDLKYIKDFAEQEYVNKFSTATLAPNVQITFGDIHETADAEKITGRIKEILEEEISVVADGDYED